MADYTPKKTRTNTEWFAARNKERRRRERRISDDRRQMIRFDLEQGERRSYQDRRNNANPWDNDHSV